MTDFHEKLATILRHCHETRDMVAVFDDPDLSRYSVGLVEDVSEEIFTLHLIGPSGQSDGLQVGRIEDIIRLSIGSEYLNAVKLLYEARDRVTIDLPPAEGYLPMDINNSLRFARDKRLVASLFFTDQENVTGFISDLGSDFVEVDEVLRDGRQDGTVVLGLETVIGVDLGGWYRQPRAFIHRVRMGL